MEVDFLYPEEVNLVMSDDVLDFLTLFV